ncbi:hypothetical protein GQX73_g9766 [Xylaria multiplex]|uniref:Kinetochore protein fta4 n=1 Tax=Xylaria multiplex TaxID=323545 RepID=A0A7C8IHT0_9PEZI|nr:hypothetical protein GQX73_g9766 [Xylaria multiplex]
MAPPTLIAHKSGFLARQTLQLSQALAPSATWRAANDRAEDGLPARVVDDAIVRLNHIVTQHSRRVHAPQTSRHIAEQIERLFYEEAERVLRGDEDEGDEGDGNVERQQLRVGADFTTDEAIASLPPTWDTQKPSEATAHPLEARRYAEQTATLTSLSTKRQEVRERVERLRRMAALLAPFESSNDNNTDINADDDTIQSTQSRTRTSVQENLITRNGEVERELERMRLLLARVAGRIAQLPNKRTLNTTNDNDVVDLDALEQDKVEKLLDQL